MKIDELYSYLKMIKQIYTVDHFQGYTESDINFLLKQFGSLPQILIDYYYLAGRTEAFQYVQDSWMLPEHFLKWEWLRRSDHMILLNENQGVFRTGIRREDLNMQNPPVYVTCDDREWKLCAKTTSDFLIAALAYESVFTFDYYPEEFYWLTDEEVAIIQQKLKKYPFGLQNWFGNMEITFFSNDPDNLVVIMDSGDMQTSYGATNEASYAKLMTVMKGIGEPL